MNLKVKSTSVVILLLVSGSDQYESCGDDRIQQLMNQNTMLGCEPRNTTVPVSHSSQDQLLLAPSHVSVSRCSGSCGHYHHQCLPAQVRRVRLPVIMSEVSVKQGVMETVCGEVEVEEHLSCR